MHRMEQNDIIYKIDGPLIVHLCFLHIADNSCHHIHIQILVHNIHCRYNILEYSLYMAGDIATLGKARRELEELYSGIPDESVNLTFQDFAQVKQLPTTHHDHSSAKSNMDRKPSGTLVISSSNNNIVKSSTSPSALSKLPSLDFNKAFEDSSIIHHHNRNNNHNLQHGHESTRNNNYYVRTTTFMDHYGEEAALHASQLGTSTDRRPPPPRDSNYNVNYGHGSHAPHHHIHHHQAISNTASTGHHQHHHQQEAAGFMDLNREHHHDIISTSSMMMSNNFMDSFQGGSSIGGTRRRRPGIPHSNICSICSVYIYMFRNNRCLVCGRVYCRQCVSIGMGEMTEGRKCIQCLGKRFSQR